MELNFTVTNQRIKYVSNLYIVEKSRNYLTAKFSFSGSEWKNVAKTAIFKKDDNVINVLLDENGRCTVPWELITRGTLKVSVFGGDLVTVDTAEVKILKSGYEEGNAPSEPTSDVYAQILAELQSIRDDFITEEMLGQAVEDWLAENVVEALSPADVEKIVYDYLDEHKDELKGEKGAVFTPHVSDEGVMSWTNDGGLENPPPVDLNINAGGEYALLTEAGYSLALSIDSNYVMTISLKNKAGEVLDSKHIDFPIESMVVNATYADGVVTFTLQNGNVLDVDISDLVRGLVPTSRTIAGVDLEDDITAEELKTALGVFDSTVTAGELKPWLYDTENEVVIGVYNGKPVYRKYFTIHVTTTNRLYTQAITDLIPDYEEILNHKMYTTSGNLLNAIYANQGTLDTQDWMCYFVNVGGNIISISRSTSQPELDNDFVFMAEYTKTTDAEGSGNSLNPYGIYDAKLDDVKSSIASVSDEVDAVEAQLSDKVLPQYKNYAFTATGWYRVAKVNSLYTSMVDLQIVRTYGNTPPEVHRVSIADTYGTNVRFLNEISSTQGSMHPKVRVTRDTANNRYIEIYCDYKSAGNNTVISLSNTVDSALKKWSLINMEATEETVDGITVLATHEFSRNKSYESEIDAINSRLAYKDISSSIDVGDTGCTASAYTENGLVHLHLSIPKGTSGVISLTINNAEYYPRIPIGGTIASLGSANDISKLVGSILHGTISIFTASALTEKETLTFVYPLKSS